MESNTHLMHKTIGKSANTSIVFSCDLFKTKYFNSYLDFTFLVASYPAHSADESVLDDGLFTNAAVLGLLESLHPESMGMKSLQLLWQPEGHRRVFFEDTWASNSLSQVHSFLEH